MCDKNRAKHPTVIGITGSIGSGKSTVNSILQGLGYPVFSADVLAREVMTPGTPTHAKIIQKFTSITQTDGTIDRSKLRKRVFNSLNDRKQLEAITHPAISKAFAQSVSKLAKSKEPIVFYEVPLLFEAGAESRTDQIVCVTASDTIRRERTLKRDGISEADFEKIDQSQISQDEKIARSDYVIENNQGFDELKKKVQDLVLKIQKKLNLNSN